MIESRTAVKQGERIAMLTYLAMAYLPIQAASVRNKTNPLLYFTIIKNKANRQLK
jgi:hypothetical protein